MKSNRASIIFIAIFATIITALLLGTIYTQYAMGSSINLGKGNAKYFVGAIMLLIPILSIILLKSYSSTTPYVDNEYKKEEIFTFTHKLH